MMTMWKTRGEIIKTVLFCVMSTTVIHN